MSHRPLPPSTQAISLGILAFVVVVSVITEWQSQNFLSQTSSTSVGLTINSGTGSSSVTSSSSSSSSSVSSSSSSETVTSQEGETVIQPYGRYRGTEERTRKRILKLIRKKYPDRFPHVIPGSSSSAHSNASSRNSSSIGSASSEDTEFPPPETPLHLSAPFFPAFIRLPFPSLEDFFTPTETPSVPDCWLPGSLHVPPFGMVEPNDTPRSICLVPAADRLTGHNAAPSEPWLWTVFLAFISFILFLLAILLWKTAQEDEQEE